MSNDARADLAWHPNVNGYYKARVIGKHFYNDSTMMDS